MTMRIHSLILIALVCALSAAVLPGAVHGQNRPAGLDSDQPIDIDADDLEVRQDQNLAVFSGNVVAVQGRIQLRAEQLKVWYRAASDDASNKAGVTGVTGGTIVRIDAISKVSVSSATENARGDIGIYEVAEQRLTLTGAVVLTRGEDVLRGNKLVMNLATGQSKISGGRVHGRFVPPQRKDGKRK
jgi:lipopolysaccharide export system protein LptA